MKERLLIVDDEPNITSSFSSLLGDEGYRTVCAGDADEADHVLASQAIDLVLLDLNLPGRSGIDFLSDLKERPEAPLVLVISGQSDIPTALRAIELGAIDYLEKPVPPDKLIASVRAALMLVRARQQQMGRDDDIDESSRIVGESKPIRKLLGAIEQAASTDANVLITGENGTGKELVATRLYLQSPRRGKPFIRVNCPGIPETLFESQLFGHKKGAFTGAVKDYPGKFVLADGGTIFLDEIGDLPPACQAKLLRVLETGEVETLGEVERRVVDVRVVCATNQPLQQLIQEHKFREDLYYRIAVFTLEAPPLRAHLDDVPLLVGQFMKRFDPSGQTKFSANALSYLSSREYRGNVRQIRNIVERMSILYSGKTITADQLIDQFPSEPSAADDSGFGEETTSLRERLAQFERTVIKTTLDDCKGNIAETARRLAMDRANLSRKIKELGIK